MGRGRKTMGHAALAHHGIAVTRAGFATDTGRRRLERLEGLEVVDRQVLDMGLRQRATVNREIADMERAINRVGRHPRGLQRLLHVRGLGLVAVGVLSEIGDVTLLRRCSRRSGTRPSTGRRWVDFYQRTKQEMGAGTAIFAAARKLLTSVHIVLTTGLDD